MGKEKLPLAMGSRGQRAVEVTVLKTGCSGFF